MFCRVSSILLVFLTLSDNWIFAAGESSLEGPFDFVVVGAGASGCVIASRLSEQKYNVLLLERGSEPSPDLEVPAKTISFFSNEEYVKTYKTLPQTNAGLLNNGTFVYLVGTTLGGSTAINGQVYNRGNPKDYDNWANITGDSSWNYVNMLQHFKRIEDYRGEFPLTEHHGKGGPIPITRPKYAPGVETWLEAGKEMGYKLSDPNGPQQVGYAPIEFNKLRGRRVNAYHGYIKPFLKTRPNLKVIKNAKVTKVILEDNKAVGVKYRTKEGKDVTVRVTKEVILSAGTLSTPVILMKSGIAPKDILDSAKISPVKYLPVGHNLQDHVFLQIHFLLKKDKAAADIFIPDRDLNPETWKLYEETGDGPYSTYNGVLAQAYLVSSVRAREAAPNPEWPDINLHLVQTPSTFQVQGLAEMSREDNEEYIDISTAIMYTRPKSHGRLILNPDDIDGDGLVNFNYLTHPDDLQGTVDAVKHVVELHETTAPYQALGARYPPTPLNSCKDVPFRSDDYWRCYVNHMSGGSAHAGGSCRMGRGQDDPDAVVDSKLRVIGISNLRVADTSIMPQLTNSNTQAPALVIGEKAAYDILQTWKDGRDEL